MGTIEQILDDLESITRDIAKLDFDDREARLEMITRVDKNRAKFKIWVKTPDVVRNLQDKPQPKR